MYKIVEGSPADKCGKIKLGDKLVEVSVFAFLCEKTGFLWVYYNQGFETE